MKEILELDKQFVAQSYQPLPVVLVKGKGIHLWDINGKRYIDMMSAYSAVSHGHCHPKIISALIEQAKTLNIVSRAFHTDKLVPFIKKICKLSGFEKALPMNTGAEAVETAIKAVRKWGETVKKIPENKAEIIVCKGNFHGRTTTIISFSGEEQYKKGFGPLTPGFKIIPYGDSEALKKAITSNTAAFLLEPIQGEAGIVVPPKGYLTACSEICKENNVLMICDEIQTGLGRTGKLFAYEHENIKPDGVTLGKALGGGVLPVSLFLSRADVMDVFTPGDHGSTFGGNPLSSVVAKTALDVLIEEDLVNKSKNNGDYFHKALSAISSPLIKEIRGKGLLLGIEIKPGSTSAHDICLALLENGLLTKETHETVIRLAPPLTITQPELDEAVAIIKKTLSSFD